MVKFMPMTKTMNYGKEHETKMNWQSITKWAPKKIVLIAMSAVWIWVINVKVYNVIFAKVVYYIVIQAACDKKCISKRKNFYEKYKQVVVIYVLTLYLVKL